jgi:uncharacterized membrane protein
MTSNIMKNLAAATVAGAFLSFAVASAAVSFAVIVNIMPSHSVEQPSVNLMQR